MNGNGEDIEVEEIVVNGESVLENMENDDGAFDPSMLCSVEITAVNRHRLRIVCGMQRGGQQRQQQRL